MKKRNSKNIIGISDKKTDILVKMPNKKNYKISRLLLVLFKVLYLLL